MASGSFASRVFTQSSDSYLIKSRTNRFARRAADIIVALIALAISAPLIVTISLLLLSTGGEILDRQTRVGRHRKQFSLITFRTTPRDSSNRQSGLSPGHEEEVTRIGCFLRRANLEKLPQLLNVLRGQMSVLGPKSEAPERVSQYPELWNAVLSVKPGVVAISRPSSYSGSLTESDPAAENLDTAKPLLDRLQVEAEYAKTATVIRDLGILSRRLRYPVSPNGSRRRGAYEVFGKRLLDLLAGTLFALLALPIQLALLLLSAGLYGWPPIVRLPSVGKASQQFRMHRLRTSPTGTRRQRAYPDVARALRRWGLDGLPQVTNVLLGQMSLVGPRAVRPEDDDELLAWQRQRWEVKPGLTGLSQLEVRSNGSLHSDTSHLDIRYIDQLSFSTDVRILLRTVFTFGGRSPASVFVPRAAGKGEILHVRLMTADSFLWLLAIPAAAWVHTGFAREQLSGWSLAAGIGLAAAAQLAWALRFGMYRGRWKIASPDDLLVTGGGAAFVTSIVLLAGWFLFDIAPSGALLTAGAFFLVGAVLARSIAALAYSRRQPPKPSTTGRLLVFGAGEVGMNAVRAVWTDEESPHVPVAFLDDDPNKARTSVLGLPVLGGRDLIGEMASRYSADTILIAMPSAHPRDVDDVASVANDAGLDVQILPPLDKWLSALLVERARSVVPNVDEPVSGTSIDIRSAADRVGGTAQFDLAVVGLGYVGLPLAMEASRIGLRVCGLDVDASRVEALNEGASYIEGISDQDLSDALNAGFVATTNRSVLTRADCVTVSVPTPLRDNLPDLSAVIGASEAVGEQLRPGQLVILESTTYPGTTEEVMQPILEELSGLEAGTDFYLAYSPERIDPGNTEWGVHNTPKLIGGINEDSTEKAATLYRKFCPVVTMTGTREAEMAKLLENTYRHVNIALVNEMAVFCRQLGVDIWETIRGAATKPFGFQAFYPGPGVGGHCIPIDPNYLSYRVRQLGEQFRLIELAQEVNDFMPQYVADQAVDLLGRSGIGATNARILMLGVAYKPNIGDTRETPANGVVRRLRESGAVVEFADPFVDSFGVDGLELVRRDDPVEASSESDLTIIHTPHDAFNMSEIQASARLVFDLRGVLPASTHERL